VSIPLSPLFSCYIFPLSSSISQSTPGIPVPPIAPVSYSALTVSGPATQILPLIWEIKGTLAKFEIKLAALGNDINGIVRDVASN